MKNMQTKQNKQKGKKKRALPRMKLRVRSIGKSGFRFQNPDFGFAIEREIRKRISTLRYLFLDFHFNRSIGKSEKGFEELSLRTAVLHAHAYLAKRRPLFTRIVSQILFRISQSKSKKEIHEIRIWIS